LRPDASRGQSNVEALLDIRRLGAVPNDATHDRENDLAFEAAVAHLKATGGGTLYVPPGSWYISRPIDIGNTQNIQIRGERAVSGDEQNSPPGAWIAVSSKFPSAATMLRLHGVRSCSVEKLGLRGWDENPTPRLRAGRGVSVEANATDQQTVFDVQLNQLTVLGIYNTSGLRAFTSHGTSAASAPAVTLTGLEAPIGAEAKFPRIEITDVSDGKELGRARFRVSLDGGKTWQAENVATAAAFRIPATNPVLTLHFSRGDYSKAYFYEGEGYGIFAGSDANRQAEQVSIRHYSAKDTAVGYFQDSNQSVTMSMERSALMIGTYGIIIEAGMFDSDRNAYYPQASARAAVEVRRRALEISFSRDYMELFGGHGFRFPSSLRTEPTAFYRVTVHNGEGHTRDGNIVDYEQLGNVTIDSCTWNDLNPGTPQKVSWRSPNANHPHIVERNPTWGAGVELETVGVVYDGPDRNGSTARYNEVTERKRGGAIAFDPLTASSARGQVLPGAAIFQQDTTQRLTFTAADSNIALQLLRAVDLADRDTGAALLVKTPGGVRVQQLTLGADDSCGPGLSCLATANPFKPSDIAGCMLDLRSTLGVSHDGRGITTWADQSGLGHDVIQNVNASKPIYVASDASFGGKPSLHFDARGTSFLQSKSFSPTSQPLTFVFTGMFASAPRFFVLGGSRSGTLQMGARDANHLFFASVGTELDGLVATLASPFIARFVVNGNQSKIYLNGRLVATGPAGTGVPDGFTVGRNPDGGNAFMQGSIVSEQVYNHELGERDARLLERYLNGLYGLGLALPN
jgi:hypothetical protein